MGFQTTRALVVSDFAAAWTVAFPGVKIYYDNGPEPDLIRDSDPFVYVVFDTLGSDLASLGNSPLLRDEYLVSFTVYTKDGTGTQILGDAYDFLCGFFRNRRFGSVVSTPIKPLRGRGDIPGWYSKGWYSSLVLTY